MDAVSADQNPNSPAQSEDSSPPPAVEAFIDRWTGKDGGERSNYQLFISELCDLLDVPRPYPSSSDNTENAYIFERTVEMRSGGSASLPDDSSPKAAGPASDPKFAIQNPKFPTGFIDCYKRGCFVFETKQGVEKKDREALSDVGRERESKSRKGHGVRGTDGWSAALIKARNQADRYARNLPASEGLPPFLIVADVGHCIELYSEFTRSGGIYTPFPADRSSRIMLDDLRRPEIRERLRLVWTEENEDDMGVVRRR